MLNPRDAAAAAGAAGRCHRRGALFRGFDAAQKVFGSGKVGSSLRLIGEAGAAAPCRGGSIHGRGTGRSLWDSAVRQRGVGPDEVATRSVRRNIDTRLPRQGLGIT